MINERIRSKPSRIHFTFYLHCTFKLIIINQPFDEDPIGSGGRVHGGIIKKLLIVFKGSVGLAAIEIGLKDEVMGDDVGNNAGLSNEAVEGEEVGITALAEEGGEDGVDGENGGAAIGVNGVARVQRGFVEIVFAN